jgi:hypothetical protein
MIKTFHTLANPVDVAYRWTKDSNWVLFLKNTIPNTQFETRICVGALVRTAL